MRWQWIIADSFGRRWRLWLARGPGAGDGGMAVSDARRAAPVGAGLGVARVGDHLIRERDATGEALCFFLNGKLLDLIEPSYRFVEEEEYHRWLEIFSMCMERLSECPMGKARLGKLVDAVLIAAGWLVAVLSGDSDIEQFVSRSKFGVNFPSSSSDAKNKPKWATAAFGEWSKPDAGLDHQINSLMLLPGELHDGRRRPEHASSIARARHAELQAQAPLQEALQQ